MLPIDADIFKKNLLITQLYCHIQMCNIVADDTLVDVSSIFRSFNPEIDGREIYEYGIEEYRIDRDARKQLIKAVYITQAPNERDDNLVENLLRDVLIYKESCLQGMPTDKRYDGDIIIMQLDYSVFDGASSAESYYLFDDFDLPPADTWFYLIDTPDTRLLFAWIPNPYLELAEQAMAVNCTGCINWFKKLYEREYMEYYTLNVADIPLK
jgi:hypothetical protein